MLFVYITNKNNLINTKIALYHHYHYRCYLYFLYITIAIVIERSAFNQYKTGADYEDLCVGRVGAGSSDGLLYILQRQYKFCQQSRNISNGKL
jgi:hypothetical protein